MTKRFRILAREYVVSLFPIFQLVDSLGNSIKRVLGFNLGQYAVFLKDNSIWWLEDEAWRQTHSRLIKKIERQPYWLVSILKQLDNKISALIHLTKKLASGQLAKLTNRELWRRYNVFVEKNTEVYDLGIIGGALLDFGETTYFTDKTRSIIRKHVSSQQVDKIFALLTTPTRRSENYYHEKALLRLYQQALLNKNLVRLLSRESHDESYLSSLGKYRYWYSCLKKHIKRYGGIIYVYEGPAANVYYFLDVMRNWLHRHLNPTSVIRRQDKNRRHLVRQQRYWAGQLKLSPSERLIFKLARELGFMKFQRRLLQSRCYYLLEPLLIEIANRLGLSVRQVRYLLPNELKRSLLTGKIKAGLVNERIKACVYLNKNGKRIILVGKMVDRVTKSIYVPRVPSNIRSLVGTVACSGKARGRVHIVNTPDDIRGMKKGGILVSFATNPNLMPAMRIAAAIVTDEGGLTSHAAIVSRELNIPCVIGTKIATKILKDGDKVEVDATKGIVRKL